MYQPNVELCSEDLIKQIISVADPVFSRGGAPTPKIAIIFQFVAENCMKMKEFGPPGGGGRVPGAPLDLPMFIYENHPLLLTWSPPSPT